MSLGFSYPYGKTEVKEFLLKYLQPKMNILDVGSGGGTYYKLLGPTYQWEAVEIWHPSAEYCRQFYSQVYEEDITKFSYNKNYDLIIFGDVLEHLPVSEAQKVLQEAEKHTHFILVAVPYLLRQGPLDGNKAEIHIQPDLTPEIFEERYPNFQTIWQSPQYGYYFKEIKE